MQIIKRNQLIILVISLMLVTAGYLNFTAREGNEIEAAGIIEHMVLAELGDATFVSGNVITEETNSEDIVANIVENSTTESDTAESTTGNTQTNSVTKDTNKTVETVKKPDDYFTNTRLERDKMYSQMIESYQKMLDSSTVSEIQKGIAQTEINNINNTKNAIMIMENLLKLKGIEDILVLINDKSVNVIVKTDELASETVAQIQNIVTREMNTDIENLHITEKK